MSKPIDKSYLLIQLKNFKTKILDPLFAKKVDIAQGSNNEGKTLKVNSEGNLEVAEDCITDITQEEYDKLSESEKMNKNKYYNITDGGTTGSDIVNNLTSEDSSKALSANQGRILNETKVSYTNILTTVDECVASTNEKDVAGAQALAGLSDSLQASVQTKYDTDSGKPMWKEQGADTWNFFKSGFPKLVATRGYSAYGHTYVYLFFDVEDFDEVKVIYGTSGYYCFPNTITEPFANTYPISSNTVTTINTVGKKYLAVAGIAIDNASYSTNFVAFV